MALRARAAAVRELDRERAVGVFTGTPDGSRIFVTTNNGDPKKATRIINLYEVSGNGAVDLLRTDVGVTPTFVFASGAQYWIRRRS